jgi:hypothetical protein
MEHGLNTDKKNLNSYAGRVSPVADILWFIIGVVRKMGSFGNPHGARSIVPRGMIAQSNALRSAGGSPQIGGFVW